MGYPHIDLLSLQVDDGILAAVLEQIFVGWNALIGEDLGEAISASGVHKVSEELKVAIKNQFNTFNEIHSSFELPRRILA